MSASGQIVRGVVSLAISVAACGAFAAGQSNDLTIHDEGDAWFAPSNPSVGFLPGSFPPDLSGDCFWRVFPGDRVLAHADAGGETMTITGFVEFLADTDWSTDPWFYDLLLGSALPSTTHPGALEPAFLQQGLTNEVFISLGPSGLGDPCAIPGIVCDPPGCPWGFMAGYLVDIRFDPGIAIPTDGTSASDLAVTWFVPGGMSLVDVAAPCPGGDFTLQGVLSTGETQGDDLGGISALGGYQSASSGPVPHAVNEALAGSIAFEQRILNVIADSGTGFGFERGVNGGGATNGLKLSVGNGLARLSFEVRSAQDASIPNQALVASSTSPLALPGITALGAQLLIFPDPLFFSVAGASAAALMSVTSACWDPDYLCFGGVGPQAIEGAADFASPFAGSPLHLSLPPGAAGLDIYSQGFVLHTATLQGHTTNRVRTSLLP